MRRPRNKIAQLPLEQRQAVITGLVDGKTYAQICEDLVAAGVQKKDLPHHSSFGAYRAGEEFRRQQDEFMNWRRRAEEKKAIWAAIQEGGGADALADVAVFESLEALRDLISGGVLTCGQDIAKVAGAIGGLKRTLIAAERARIDVLLKEKAVLLQQRLADGNTASDPVAVADTLREILGVK